jgi:hypothetical protein
LVTRARAQFSQCLNFDFWSKVQLVEFMRLRKL